jgi:hypothetical protein
MSVLLRFRRGLGEFQTTWGRAGEAAVLVESQVWSTRNLVANSLVGTGLIMAGFTPFFARPNAKAHFATAASIASGPLQDALQGPSLHPRDVQGCDRIFCASCQIKAG